MAAAWPLAGQNGTTALDRYVAKPDAAYKWSLVKTTNFPTGTAYVLEMTSQEWLTEKEVNRTAWKHWLTVVRPKEVKSKTGFLFITGGNNSSPEPPKSPDLGLVEAAVTTNTVVAELRMVPNQPLTFVGDTPGTEDHLISWTWLQYVKTGDEKWPMRLPMTKAAVRAMDTVTAFCKSPEGGGVDVEKFVVSGGSKRGWTAWTTAAVDALNGKRVAAVVPFVIDLLNIEPSFQHHWRAYGFWAPAVGDYVKRGLMDWNGTKEYRNLMKIEEPFEYRDRLTLPKYVVNAAGDQFFLPDSSQFYWDKLKGEKYLRYVPNTDHSMRNSDALQAAVAFYDAIAKGKRPPQYSWKLEKNGNIVVTPQGKPSSVKLWQATNPAARDFRLMTIGPAYKATELKPDGKGRYVGVPVKPEKGWSAYFVEVTWPSETKYPFKFTSPVRVWPETYPHGPYQPKRPLASLGSTPAANALLRELAQEDQAARREGGPKPARSDQDRIKLVLEQLAKGAVVTPEDKFHAALILQHTPLTLQGNRYVSMSPDNYLLGHQLAKSAFEAGHPGARLLVAQSLDRYLTYTEGYQKYGTNQVLNVETDKLELVPVDRQTTDHERAQYGVPALAELLSKYPEGRRPAGQ